MGVDRWNPGGVGRGAKRVGVWHGGGGGAVDRQLGEVRGVRYRGEWNLIDPLLSVLFMSVF